MSGAARHYIGAAGREYHEKKRGIPDRAVSWVARLRAEKIQPFVRPEDTVFEFGAGFGWNLFELRCARKAGYDVADLPRDSSGSVEWVKEMDALPDAFADVVLCHHALEHVLNPPGVLDGLRRVSKPTAKLLLYVPFEKERRYKHFDPQEPNHHLYSWNAQTLGNLVSECGWVVESAGVGRFGYDRFAARWALKFRVGERGFRLVRAMAHLLRPAHEVRVVASMKRI